MGSKITAMAGVELEIDFGDMDAPHNPMGLMALAVSVLLFISLALQTFNTRCIVLGVSGAVGPVAFIFLSGAKFTEWHLVLEAILFSLFGTVSCAAGTSYPK